MDAAENFETLVGEVLSEMGHVTEPALAAPSTTIAELKLDSLSMLEFLMLLEEKTGIEVTTDELGTDTTLSQLTELLRRKAA